MRRASLTPPPLLTQLPMVREFTSFREENETARQFLAHAYDAMCLVAEGAGGEGEGEGEGGGGDGDGGGGSGGGGRDGGGRSGGGDGDGGGGSGGGGRDRGGRSGGGGRAGGGTSAGSEGSSWWACCDVCDSPPPVHRARLRDAAKGLAEKWTHVDPPAAGGDGGGGGEKEQGSGEAQSTFIAEFQMSLKALRNRFNYERHPSGRGLSPRRRPPQEQELVEITVTPMPAGSAVGAGVDHDARPNADAGAAATTNDGANLSGGQEVLRNADVINISLLASQHVEFISAVGRLREAVRTVFVLSMVDQQAFVDEKWWVEFSERFKSQTSRPLSPPSLPSPSYPRSPAPAPQWQRRAPASAGV